MMVKISERMAEMTNSLLSFLSERTLSLYFVAHLSMVLSTQMDIIHLKS